MREILSVISDWISNRKKFAIASVIKTWGSSPRPLGSMMIISQDGEMVGSVSGGCVEASVLKEVPGVIESGRKKVLGYGVSNEEAWGFGLTCGGRVSVLLEPFWGNQYQNNNEEHINIFKNLAREGRPMVMVSAINNKEPKIGIFSQEFGFLGRDEELKNDCIIALEKGRPQILEKGEESYFLSINPNPLRLILFGAAHITVHLVELAKMYDFEVHVVDPRSVFTNKTHFEFPPDKITTAYPSHVFKKDSFTNRDFAVVLSHDPKIDDDALKLLLDSKTAYIGALGSRKTHQKRISRLMELGFSQKKIDRISSPVGLDIGGKSAKEIALSIMAELIQVKNQP